MRRVLTDPLTHFVLAGAGIFLLYSWHRPPKPRIEVTAAVQKSLAEEYELLQGHPPDAGARAELLDKYIADEVLFREALARGMHLTDAKTRERLTEKLRFSLTGTIADPTPEELVNFYADHLSQYYSEPKLTFDQVFFAKPPSDPAQVLARLRSGERVSSDPFWLGSRFQDYPRSMLRGALGQHFIERVYSAPTAEWSGPIESARGVHFVRVTAISPSEVMPFVQVRQQVEADWFARERDSSVQTTVHLAEEKYDVQVQH